MSRVYIAESCLSITGTVADERSAARGPRASASWSPHWRQNWAAGGMQSIRLSRAETAFIDSAAADLLASKGAGAVAIGSHLPPEVHHLGLAINEKIGALNRTVTVLDSAGRAIGQLILNRSRRSADEHQGQDCHNPADSRRKSRV